MALPFKFNAIGIINAAMSELDWSPTLADGSDLKDALFTDLNMAMLDVFEDFPFTFSQHTFTVITQPDAQSVDGQTADRLVISDAAGLVLGRLTSAVSGTPAGVLWDFSGYWSGRTLEIQETDGTLHYRTVMETWQQASHDYVTLDRPLTAPGSPYKYRFLTENYPIPVQAINIKNAQITAPHRMDLRVITQEEMDSYGYDTTNFTVYGQPYEVSKGDAYSLPSTVFTPVLHKLIFAVDADYTTWVTTEDVAGTFDYVWTLCYGRLHTSETARSGFRRPRYESNPSPISATISTTQGAGAIRITTPNVSRQYGYGPLTNLRDGHSGYFKRIYGRRSAVETGALIHIVETQDKFWLVGECDGDSERSYHTGSPAMDMTEPLRHYPVYQTVRFWPRADAEYTMLIRCHAIPDQLVNDNDVPPLTEGSARLLILKLQERILSGKIDDVARKAVVMAEYNQKKATTRSNYGMHAATQGQRQPATIRGRLRRNLYPKLGTVER